MKVALAAATDKNNAEVEKSTACCALSRENVKPRKVETIANPVFVDASVPHNVNSKEAKPIDGEKSEESAPKDNSQQESGDTEPADELKDNKESESKKD